jgi:hypothetical protein
MKKKHILLVVSLGVLALSLWGFSLIPWVEGSYRFEPVNKLSRPFPNFHSIYPREIYVKEQYQRLYIKEMSYELDGRSGVFLEDKSYELYTEDWGRYFKAYRYDSLTGEYRFALTGIDRHIRENINNKKLFKGRKRGDVFRYTVKITYSLDDEPESTQILEHNIKVVMGRYSSTFFYLIARILALVTPM